MSSPRPIRLALFGTGLFARDAHVPAIKALGDTFEIVAIYTRHPGSESAAALAAQVGGDVALTDDLDALLARDDVEAVDIIWPIPRLPEGIERALKAGKHVISEKPASPDVGTGHHLLDVYAGTSGLVWMVAENWRYDSSYRHAAKLIREGAIGRPLTVDWAHYSAMTPDNQYYTTPWRRDESFMGGYLLDGGVHHIAALRMILGEIASVSAAVTQHRPDLPPTDTLSAALVFENGAIGAYSVTYARPAPWKTALHIVGESGALSVNSDGVEITPGDGETRTVAPDGPHGVEGELAAFAAAIREGATHVNPPEQAVQDVAVIEAMLRSAETGQRVAPERIVTG